MHYDARSRGEKTSWSKENFILQQLWLKEHAELDHIFSNKNHYTRWENRLDCLRWCEEVGSPHMLNVLEINLITQDLVVVCPAEYGRQLVDSVLRHHGVAHFLFHPAHIEKPHVAEALFDLVEYGRIQGLEWWTSEQIYQWETGRRSVRTRYDCSDSFTLYAEDLLPEATLLFLNSKIGPRSIHINGVPASLERRQLYGFEFDAVNLDLSGEVQMQII